MRKTKKEMLYGIEEQVEKSRFVGANTLSIQYKDGRNAIRFHETDIVTEKDGIVTLNSGGWRTYCTKDRINSYADLPTLSQRNFQWFIGDGIFYDGMQFRNGVQISHIKTDNKLERKKMLSKIDNYCALITADNLPVPSSGDCFFCSLGDKDGVKLGDLTKDVEHLLSHMEEGYVVGSLLVNAMRESGFRNGQISVHYGMKIADTFRRAVKKYLTKRLVG